MMLFFIALQKQTESLTDSLCKLQLLLQAIQVSQYMDEITTSLELTVFEKSKEIELLQNSISKLNNCKQVEDGTIWWTIQAEEILQRGELATCTIHSKDFHSREGHTMSAEVTCNREGSCGQKFLSISLTVGEWPESGASTTFPYDTISFKIMGDKEEDHFERIMELGAATSTGSVILSPEEAMVEYQEFLLMSEIDKHNLDGELCFVIKLDQSS